jgi:hypothetical protein
MNDCLIMESSRIADAYSKIGIDDYKKTVNKRLFRKRHGNKLKLKESNRLREYPVMEKAQKDDNCSYLIESFDFRDHAKNVIFNSLIDDNVDDAISRFYDGNRGKLCSEIMSPTDLIDGIKFTVDRCRKDHSIKLPVGNALMIVIKKNNKQNDWHCVDGGNCECDCCKCDEATVSESIGDMSDADFKKWWDGLTDEQREEQLSKIPDDVWNGVMEDPQNADVAKKAALLVGGTSYVLRKIGGKTAGKAITKAAVKGGGKALGKSILKKIPGIGTLAGIGFAASRLWGRDKDGKLNITKGKNWLKAGGELASGAASLVPGVGTALGAGIDAALAYDDIKDAQKEAEAEAANQKQVAENDEEGEVNSSDSEYPIPQDDLFSKKTYASARNYLEKKIAPMTKGFFRDDDWHNVHNVFKAISDMGVNLNWGTRNDNFYSHGYHENRYGTPDSKAYSFDIKYTNVVGKKMKLSGQIIASGAGTVENPLERYDMIFQIF